MNFPTANPPPAPDARLDRLLGGQPRTPAADFPARTLARVRAEVAQCAALRAGDELALDRLLALPAITPAPDFVARTLARVRAENGLFVAARAGDDPAVDALLDRWLSDQPLAPDAEPEFIASQTRREARRPAPPRAEPAVAPWRRLLAFPQWARPAVGLAAALAVAFLALFYQPAPSGDQSIHLGREIAWYQVPAPVAAAGETTYAATGGFDDGIEVNIGDLLDAETLLSAENVDVLMSMTQAGDDSIY